MGLVEPEVGPKACADTWLRAMWTIGESIMGDLAATEATTEASREGADIGGVLRIIRVEEAVWFCGARSLDSTSWVGMRGGTDVRIRWWLGGGSMRWML